MLWIPAGFGHGFAALTETAWVSYKVTDFYNAAGDRTLLWTDPGISMNWPVAAGDAIVSEKDLKGKLLADAEGFD